MRDAFGGVANLVIIVVFLALVSGYLAFNVNYTKAFRVKNKIISTIEEYEGSDDCLPNQHGACNVQITEYMGNLGYRSPELKIDDYKCGQGYCVKKICKNNNSESDIKNKAYFKVITQISIDIPIINKILPQLKIFQVSGDTKTIVVKNSNGSC